MKSSLTAIIVAAGLVAAAATLPASAQGVAFQKQQQAGELAAVRLAGTRIFNTKGEVIGTIADVVLGADGRAVTVVINVGGVLSVGSKVVAVPYSALKVGPVVESSRVLLLDVTTAQLQAAPTYAATDPGRVERAKKKASDWIKIAKDKAVELGKQAGDAVQGAREKMSAPAPTGGIAPAPAPAPKQ